MWQNHPVTVRVPFFAPNCHWMDDQSPSHRTRLSVNDNAGETDVSLVVDLDSRERVAVMIEGKLPARSGVPLPRARQPRMQFSEQQSYEGIERAEMKL
jgi:hypothetical protein